MTREEQIRQAGIEYTLSTRPMCIGGGAFSEIVDEMNRNYAFEEGAKWADKTIIDKACKWMREEFYTSKDRDGHNILVSASWDNVEELINDFEKQMEE